MNLEQIYHPIKKELEQVEIELKRQVQLFNNKNKHVSKIIEYFFRVPGKRLRPALVLLSGFMVKENLDSKEVRELIILATAIELIHAASLVHDDIIDKELERRGQETLNMKFGNKIAVLAGDLLYVRAFDMLIEQYDKNIIKTLINCVSRMCGGEITELQLNGEKTTSMEEYMKVIEDKTADFMSVCCHCGALLALKSHQENGPGRNTEQATLLREYGFNLGVTYQLMDDYYDDDSIHSHKIDLQEKAKEYASKAKHSIKTLKDSAYKAGLSDLADCILKICNDKKLYGRDDLVGITEQSCRQ